MSTAVEDRVARAKRFGNAAPATITLLALTVFAVLGVGYLLWRIIT